MEQQLMERGGSTAPVQSSGEGITRALLGVAGGFFAGRDRRKLEAEEAAQSAEVNAILRGLQPQPIPPPEPIDDPGGGDYEAANFVDGLYPPTHTGGGFPGAIAAGRDATSPRARAMLRTLMINQEQQRQTDVRAEQERRQAAVALAELRRYNEGQAEIEHARAIELDQLPKAPGEGGGTKYGNTLIWGTDEDGNAVLMQSSNQGGPLRIAKLPEGVKARRGQTSRVDLGDKWAILDANGTVIGYQPKGLGQSRSIVDGATVTLPSVSGGVPTDASGGPVVASDGVTIPSNVVTTGSGITVEQLPLSPTAVAQAAVGTETKAVGAGVMLTAIRGAKEQLQLAQDDWLSFGGSGTASRLAGWNSSSYAGKVRSYIGTLKSGIVEQGIKLLRESSSSGATGFGAMNKEELQVLINRLGALEPTTTDPEILLETLSSIEKQTMRVMADIQKNVSPERLKKLGLSDWVSGDDGSNPPAAGFDPNDKTTWTNPAGVPNRVWDAMTDVQRALF
jgi:hypothetical protein